MKSSVRARLAAVVLGLAPFTAGASHYMVEDVPDVIPEAQHALLARQGISNTAQLYERVVSRAARAALAKGSGLSASELDAWARFLDLMQLNGIGPKMVRLLNAAGIPTLAAFQKADPAVLVVATRVANQGAKYSETLPNQEILAGWIEAAKKLPIRLE